MSTTTCHLESPLGLLELTATSTALTAVRFVDAPPSALSPAADHPILTAAATQLTAYFAQQRRTFELPLDPHGTEFQQAVWTALQAVPYGQTASYLSLAEQLNQPQAVRAVGAANGRNPIAIIIPCHRIIGSQGDLVGYGGGLWRKTWLLKHEGSLLV